jgi:hypothetical protein
MKTKPTELHHNWGPTEWASYVREAQGKAVASIIETGKRLREAHVAYKGEPQRWGTLRWNKWAMELGYSQSTVSHYEIIAQNFSNTVTKILERLPAAWGTLYMLAQMRRDAPKVFNAALASGRISPEMTRAQAEELVAEINEERRLKAEKRAQRAKEARDRKRREEDEARQRAWQSKTAEEREQVEQEWRDRREKRQRQKDEWAHNFWREMYGDPVMDEGSDIQSSDINEIKKNLERMSKFLGIFGSDHANEVISAARQADALRRKLGVNWSDILTVPQMKRKVA